VLLQTLRLPRKLMLTLLTYNRALLTCSGQLKERLLFLQDTMEVDGEGLPSIRRGALDAWLALCFLHVAPSTGASN
jgi:hypothetical protein